MHPLHQLCLNKGQLTWKHIETGTYNQHALSQYVILASIEMPFFGLFSTLGLSWHQVLLAVAQTQLLLPLLHPCACCRRAPVEDERVSKQLKQVATSVSLKHEQPQLSLSRLVLPSVTLQTYKAALRF